MDSIIEEITTDVLIIGAGGAGVRASIELARHGIDCLVLGKRAHGDAHTIWAAGGINASLGTLDPDDRWDIHAADTLKEGHFLNQPEAVLTLCREAPYRVLELDEWGADFNKAENGRINQRYFGAQSFRRTCFVGDQTGKAVLTASINEAKRLGVPYRQNIYITKLLRDDTGVVGAMGVDLDTGQLAVLRARAVVLAAGGHTSVYKRSSSRPDENTGDAQALALDAGATLRDMEMVQFHPTGRAWPEEEAGHLVTEAVRGEGGRLFNTEGERFMERYSPDQMELDARDVVARANYREIQEGRGTERGGVLLDISHRDADFIKERLPRMYAIHREDGVDITKEPMEVAPTAHYAMGGVAVDFSTGATDVPGLYAVGEATSGVHGANRLGGNSLAEIFVFGKVVGAHLVDALAEHPLRPVPEQAVDAHAAELAAPMERTAGPTPDALNEQIREVMWNAGGIVRREEDLLSGLAALGTIREQAATMQIDGDMTSVAFEQGRNVHCMLDAGEAILRSALERTESRGAHYRDDYPDTDPAWQRNICVHKTTDGLALFTTSVPDVPEAVKEALQENHTLDYHHLE